MTFDEAQQKLERRIAWAIREHNEAREREAKARRNMEKYSRRRDEMRRHTSYLQERKRELEAVKTAMNGLD